jgi:2C-methyl-D-erythritol 2,4-cyclodiphosphate synthase
MSDVALAAVMLALFGAAATILIRQFWERG